MGVWHFVGSGLLSVVREVLLFGGDLPGCYLLGDGSHASLLEDLEEVVLGVGLFRLECLHVEYEEGECLGELLFEVGTHCMVLQLLFYEPVD